MNYSPRLPISILIHLDQIWNSFNFYEKTNVDKMKSFRDWYKERPRTENNSYVVYFTTNKCPNHLKGNARLIFGNVMTIGRVQTTIQKMKNNCINYTTTLKTAYSWLVYLIQFLNCSTVQS